ncbi:MAG: 3-keto-5-aminohexanoate cleavage protein [Emcibacteraceae bacterium]|nr:3-keto-5-aminohexanoate cleavage protein [Emcibacteraceae bacterium]
MTKTIITCAVTGNLTSRDMHPGLPITPMEIANAALEAASAGASIVHLHVRDPETGKGSMDFALYDEMFSRIREKNTDVIINLTTGEGGRFVPSKDNPKIAAENSTLCRPELRVSHVEKLKPEICTLDLNTMWSGQAAVINSPENLKIMAERIYAAGVKPEIEVFNSSDLHLLNHFIAEGVIKTPVMVQMVMGVRFGAPANSETMMYMKSQLPENSVWAAFGIARMEYPMLAQAYVMGGHVRVGMEDNLYIKKGELCTGNAQLVEKAVRILHDLGGSIASTNDAREILGL